MKYKTKLEYIDAVHWTGDNYEDVSKFTGGHAYLFNKCLFVTCPSEGSMMVNTGQYLIRKNGKYVAMDEEIFNNRYEKVTEKSEV